MQNGCTGIKRILHAVICFAVIVVLTLCFCGCESENGNKSVSCNLVIVDSLFVEAKNNVATVEYGEDFCTEITVKSGYFLSDCSHSNYELEVVDGKTYITLKKVIHDERVILTTEQEELPIFTVSRECDINYDFNGGVDGNGNTQKSMHYNLSAHLRANTYTASTVTKSGYVLIGWNTKADGSGEHIGLGSRVTIPKEKSLTLYAEWEKAIDGWQVRYKKLSDDEIELIGYLGDGKEDKFVIPSTVDGYTVVKISSSFTMNIPCGDIKSKTLVLPNTVKTVEGGAFYRSNFEEIYFSDNIESVSEFAFPNNIKTWHINAVLEPCFLAENNNTAFADSIDRFILGTEKNKIVLFSGCSFGYGMNSYMLYDALNGQYEVFNAGINGDINAEFQFDIITHYMEGGDVFVHAPEQMSAAQLMYSHFTNNTMFLMVEGNYDLLALADFSENAATWRAFADYIEVKAECEPCSYSDGVNENFDMHGDFVMARPYDESNESERDVSYSDDNYRYNVDFITDEGMDKLCDYYNKIESRGAKVLVSYAPVNISARGGTLYGEGIEYAQKFESEMQKRGYDVISNVTDYMFKGRYFYDSDYHLNGYGAILRTEQLIKDLKASGALALLTASDGGNANAITANVKTQSSCVAVSTLNSESVVFSNVWLVGTFCVALALLVVDRVYGKRYFGIASVVIFAVGVTLSLLYGAELYEVGAIACVMFIVSLVVGKTGGGERK